MSEFGRSQSFEKVQSGMAIGPFRWVGRAEKANASLPGLAFFPSGLSRELPGQNRPGSVFPKGLRLQKPPAVPIISACLTATSTPKSNPAWKALGSVFLIRGW